MDVCARVSNGSLCAVELVAVVKIRRLLSVQWWRGGKFGKQKKKCRIYKL